MPAVTTVPGTGGNWSNPSAWSTGLVPDSLDQVTIGNPRTLITAIPQAPGSILTVTSNAHGYVNDEPFVLGCPTGAQVRAPLMYSNVYYMRNVTANTFQIARTPGGTPLVDQGGYFGGSGAGVFIARPYVMVFDMADTVVDALFVHVGATFQAATTMSTQLRTIAVSTCYGGGKLAVDLLAHPTRTFKWLLPGLGGWGSQSLRIQQDSNYHVLRGKFRKRRANLLTTLTQDVSTSFQVSDATGWEVGDRLIFSATQPRNGSTALRASTVFIASITPGAGTIATITFTGSGAGGNTTNNPHLVGGLVCNFTSNVIFESFNKADGQRGHIHLSRQDGFNNSEQYLTGSTDAVRSTFVENVLFDSLGVGWAYSLDIMMGGDRIDHSIGGINSNAFFEHSRGLRVTGGTSTTFPNFENVFYQTLIGGHAFEISGYSAPEEITGWASVWSRPDQGADFRGNLKCVTRNLHLSGTTIPMWINSGGYLTHYGLETYGYELVAYGTGITKFVDSSFAKFVTGFSGNRRSIGRASGSGEVEYVNCDTPFPNAHSWPVSWLENVYLQAAPLQTFYTVNGVNGDPTIQQVYSAHLNSSVPLWSRDNVLAKNSPSSLVGRFSHTYVMARVQTIQTISGVPIRVKGSLRKDAAYGSGTRPTVSIVGFGVTVTQTMPDVTDTWWDFTLDYVQSSGQTGPVEFRFEHQTTSVTGKCWLSGTVIGNMIQRSRHYGYKFNETSTTQEVNPFVGVLEAEAIAYTGVTLNTVTPSITIGAGTANTFHKVYDYIQAWACLNVDSPVLLTTTDDITFTVPTNCEVSWPGMSTDGTLSGGILRLAAPGVHTYRLSGCTIRFEAAGTYAMGLTVFSGTVTLVNTSGGAVIVEAPVGVSFVNTGPSITVQTPSVTQSVTLLGVPPASRVQIYDYKNDVELFNGISGYSWVDPAPAVLSRDIRVRVARVNGADADQFKEYLAGTCGITAETCAREYIVSQVPDATYNANGLVGSSITGITFTDNAVDLVNCNIAGGLVTWGEIYAAFAYWTYTAAGIANDFTYISAPDPANYLLSSMKIRNVSAVDLLVTGGYGRDATTLSSRDIIDTAGSTGNIFLAPDHVVAYQTLGSPVITGDISAVLTAVGNVPANVLTAANANPIASDVREVNGVDLQGSGTTLDPMRPS